MPCVRARDEECGATDDSGHKHENQQAVGDLRPSKSPADFIFMRECFFGHDAPRE